MPDIVRRLPSAHRTSLTFAVVMRDHNNIHIEAKLSSLESRSRAEWQLWLQIMRENSSIQRILDVEVRYPLRVSKLD